MIKSFYNDFSLEIKIAGEKKKVKEIVDELLGKFSFKNEHDDSFDKAIYRHMKLSMLTMKNNNSSKTFFCILYHGELKTFHMIQNSTVVEISNELFYCHIMDISTCFSTGDHCRYYVLNDNFQETFNKMYDFMMSKYSIYHEKLYSPVEGLSVKSVINRNVFIKEIIDEFIVLFHDIEPVFMIAFFRSLTLHKE